MSLPKIQYPIYKIKIPSTKKEVKFRPFLVKEEKLLLMAKESDNNADILQAVKQIVNNCCIDENFDEKKLTIFDLEYLFVKLRAFSVDNIIKISYRDTEDNQSYNFDVDLNDVEVIFPEKNENNIKITDKFGILMKYPSASLYEDKNFLNLDKDYLFELIIRCIDKIYEEDSVYEAKDYSHEDLSNFLENLDSKTFVAIQDYLINSPKLSYTIKYKNSLDTEREIVLSSLNDFFTFR